MEETEALSKEKLSSYVTKVKQGNVLDGAEHDEALTLFEAYECWEPAFEVLKRDIASDDKNTRKGAYVRKASICNTKLHNGEEAVELILRLVQDIKPSFAELNSEILPLVLNQNDARLEASILGKVASALPNKADIVPCLEHLCLLLEKKIHNDDEIGASYDRLINVDPENPKALRYFKQVYSQSQEWDQVAEILRTMLKCKKGIDVYRVGQELAAVTLYYLDQPSASLEILEKYTQGSPLDTSTIRYDACRRLSDWQGCINVLRSLLSSEEGDEARSVIHYRIGEFFRRLEEDMDALSNYETSAKLQHGFQEPVEQLINLYLRRKDWDNVVKWLTEFSERCQSGVNKTKVDRMLSLLVTSGKGASVESP